MPKKINKIEVVLTTSTISIINTINSTISSTIKLTTIKQILNSRALVYTSY